jgi:hypothetical protein
VFAFHSRPPRFCPLVLLGQHPISTPSLSCLSIFSSLRPSSFYRRCHAASAILILPASAVLVTSIPSPPPFGCRLSVLRCSYSCASSPHCLIFTPASDSVSVSPLSWAVCAPPLFFISSIPPLLLLLSWSVAWISRCYVKASRSPPLGGTYCHESRLAALAHPSKTVP